MKIRFFELAKKVSNRSTSRFQLGAVVVDKRKNVLNVGFNDMVKTHPRCNHLKGQHTNTDQVFPFLHAEIRALIGLDEERTRGGSIYVYRKRKDGSAGNAKPCVGCMTVIKQMGIHWVYYTGDDGYKTLEVK
jgi:deoxycytidylate deaminase